LKIFEFLDSLSACDRWSQAHRVRRESVLEHTGFVVLYSVHLACKYDVKSDILFTATLKSAVHDMEEALIGDIPTPTKYWSGEVTDAINEAGFSAAGLISDDLFTDDIFELWASSKDLMTKSGQIVAIADIASVVHKIQQEDSLGNKNFRKYIPNVLTALDSLMETESIIVKTECTNLKLSLRDYQ